MTKIWVGIQFEGPTDAEELMSCIEESLALFKAKELSFASTAEDEPIVITEWNPNYVEDGDAK